MTLSTARPRAAAAAILVAHLLLLPLTASVPARGAPHQRSIDALTGPSETLRFDAIMRLIAAKDTRVGKTLSQALQRPDIRESTVARAAVEFVIGKRSGALMDSAPASKPAGTSVLLISIDALRADHLGCYGYPRATSPNLDVLARRGTLFRNAFSPASWTLPAHMSMFTSLYPSFHKLENGGRMGSARLDGSEETLAQILKGAGYATAAFVAHPFLDSEWGFDRGFDMYKRSSARADLQTRYASLWLEWYRYRARRVLVPDSFFLFLHYIDPHETYQAPEPFLHRFSAGYMGPLRPSDHLVTMFIEKEFPSVADFQYVLDLYDGEISYVDAHLGKLFKTLRDVGLGSSTIVIVTSDHGEEFKDHGSMGHKTTLYDEQLRVPLIMAWPGRIVAGQQSTNPVSLLDILPTVLDLTGQKPLPKAQGASLRPGLIPGDASKGGTFPPRRELFAELGSLGYKWGRPYCRRAIRGAGYKLILTYLKNGRVSKELFDLSSDPAEQTNLYADKKNLKEVRRLESRLVEFIREGNDYNPDFHKKNEFTIDETLQEKLRALGYVD